MKRAIVFLVFVWLMLLSAPLWAADVNLSWTNATQNVDGTYIPTNTALPEALATTTLYWGACLPDDTPAAPLSEVVIPTTVPGASESATVIITTPGRWCFVGVHANVAGQSSGYSNPAFRTITQVPTPPADLTVTNMTVYYVIQQPGRFILVPVGTIPSGTACDDTQYVNGFFAVPVAQVSWTGTARPLVVVAQCG